MRVGMSRTKMGRHAGLTWRVTEKDLLMNVFKKLVGTTLFAAFAGSAAAQPYVGLDYTPM